MQPTCPNPAGSVAQSEVGGAPPTARSPRRFHGLDQSPITTSGTSDPSWRGSLHGLQNPAAIRAPYPASAWGAEQMFQLLPGARDLHAERGVALPGRRPAGSEPQQATDPFDIGLASAAAELGVQRDLAIAARLAAERRSNAKDRLPHSTKKIARVGACPDRPHLRCVTRKPVGPQYGITLLAAEGPDGVDEGIGVGADLCQVDPLVGRVHPAARRTAHHGGNTGGFPQG